MAIVSIGILVPLFTLFENSFSDHMILHLILMDALAPGLVVGAFFLWLLPPPFRQKLLQRLNPIQHIYGFLTKPLLAFTLSTLFLWFSHIPFVFNLTLTNDSFHALIHTGLLATAIFYWQPLTDTKGRFPKLGSNESRIFYLLAGATQGTILGSLIAFSPQVLYTNYLQRLSYSAALLDQQSGGAIMLFSGILVYVLAAIFSLEKTT